MWIRFQVFRARHKAKLLSKHAGGRISAKYADLYVGSYEDGRKVW